MIDRRRFLSSTLLASAGMLAGGKAFALTLREATPGEAEAYQLACQTRNQYHDQLVREVMAILDGQGVAEEQKQEVLRAMTCPLCGCTLAQS